MKSQDLKEEFIRLRAKGLSFDKISKEIKTSKPTLLKWNEELEKEIANLSYFEVEIMIEQYRLAKINKIEGFALVLQNAIEELKKRDFSEINTKDLLGIISVLESKLKIELKPVEYRTDTYQGFFDEIDFSSKRKTLPLLY